MLYRNDYEIKCRASTSRACHDSLVYEDDPEHESFEETLRSIAREVSRSVERMTELNLDEIAGSIGVDAARASEWFDEAGRWLRTQAAGLGDDLAFSAARPGSGREQAARPGGPADEDPLRSAGPHPLDLPTGGQGLALAALDSGRWTVEPGSNVLVAHGEGPGPSDALGLVGELRARDWIGADGEVTLVGRHALSRWLDAADPR
jgi:hypothetical protein